MFFVCIHVLLSNTIVKCFGHQAYCGGEKVMAERLLHCFRRLLQLIYRENYCCPS